MMLPSGRHKEGVSQMMRERLYRNSERDRELSRKSALFRHRPLVLVV
jgi:hypothetical protein